MKLHSKILLATVFTFILFLSAGCSATPETPRDPFVGEYTATMYNRLATFTFTEDGVARFFFLNEEYGGYGVCGTWEKTSDTTAKILLPNLNYDPPYDSHKTVEYSFDLNTCTLKNETSPRDPDVILEKQETLPVFEQPKQMCGTWNFIGGYSTKDSPFNEDFLGYDIAIHIANDGSFRFEVEETTDDVGQNMAAFSCSKWYVYKNYLCIEGKTEEGINGAYFLSIQGDRLYMDGEGILCFEK